MVDFFIHVYYAAIKTASCRPPSRQLAVYPQLLGRRASATTKITTIRITPNTPKPPELFLGTHRLYGADLLGVW
jgi:hypothetical protein